jgi:hypothetical protein
MAMDHLMQLSMFDAVEPLSVASVVAVATAVVFERDSLADLPSVSDHGVAWRGFYVTAPVAYVPEPAGDWHYVVDEFGIQYAPVTAPLVFRRCTPDFRGGDPLPVVDPENISTTVGLTPDPKFQGWENQRVTISEEHRQGRVFLSAVFQVTVTSQPSPEGSAHRIARIEYEAPMGAWDSGVFNAGLADIALLPTWAEAEAHRKVARIVAWYESEKARRAQGLPLVTAENLWVCRLEEERRTLPPALAEPEPAVADPGANAHLVGDEDKPELLIDDELYAVARKTCSPDTIYENQRLRGTFEWDDRLWVATSTGPGDVCQAIRICVRSEYQGKSHRGRRYASGKYDGLVVTFRQKEYVIAAKERLTIFSATYAETHPDEVIQP